MEEDSICIIFPALWSQACIGTTKSSEEGRREDRVSTWHCAGTWHRRGIWDTCWDDLISTSSLLYVLSWLISGILPPLPLIFLSEWYYHPPWCPSQKPRSSLLEGNILLSPPISREDRISTPLPRREAEKEYFWYMWWMLWCHIYIILSCLYLAQDHSPFPEVATPPWLMDREV